MPNVLLKNVHFIGLKNHEIQNGMDLAIDRNGLIEKIDFNIPDPPYDRIIDLSQYVLSPGWIDLHTHIYYGVSNLGVQPDIIGPATGVSVLVDAGSAGEITFAGFREYIIKQHDFPIYAFMNVGSIGLVWANQISELDTLEKMDLDRLMECIEQNRAYIIGVKLRASGVILRGWGHEIVKIGRRVAEEAELPLMVHVGEPLPLLEDILPLMRPGDIITHCYHGKRWGILKKYDLIPEVKEAVQRGVRFDVGHGAASFNLATTERALELGFTPFSISTDIHQHNVNGPVWDLPTTMSKMLSLGLSLEEVIRCVTSNPAQILGVSTFADTLIGEKARFTIFSLLDRPVNVMDSNGNERVIKKIIEPAYTILANRVIEARSRSPK
ncbi:MAG: amidohydrolase/deacetylase family metallohydrolase [bacterium]|nr:amidohydrolase/deacetylase family metallohydrolase [bacterium]